MSHDHEPDLERVEITDNKDQVKTVCKICGVPMTVDFAEVGGSSAGGRP